MTNAIETTDLTKQFGDLTAVDGINLSVEQGRIHGFVGQNGAGKTTTIQMLVGLLSPTAGSATICGEPAGSLAAKKRIGYSPQEPQFYSTMTGYDYLRYMGKTAGMGGDAADRAKELLEWLDLDDAAHKKIGGYSGGMKRRLSMAQAVIHDPDVLILDEPTATLDPEGRKEIIDALQDMTDEGMTVFVSSHVLDELEKFIEYVTILHEGTLVESGPLDAIQDKVETEGGLQEAFLEIVNDDTSGDTKKTAEAEADS